MKTNKLLLGLLLAVGMTAPQFVVAQDVSINIFPLQLSIPNNTTGSLEVTICNEDPENIPAPADRLMPLISFPDNLTIKDVVNPDGTPVTGFSILALTNDPDNHNVRLLYNNLLQNEDCVIFHIRVTGNTVGSGITTATLGFDGPQTPGNLTGNDNAVAVMPVEINLPVTLQVFSAITEGTSALLTWSTTEETNSDRFDVQRSKDGKKWATFQTVKALGESSAEHSYSATDENPFSGENLYRLHMIDKDGTSAYSNIRSVNFEVQPTSFFPNPVSDILKINTPDLSKVSGVSIVNSGGVKVYQSASKIDDQIDVSKLNAGMYIVNLMLKNGEESNYKVVISR